MFAFIFTFFFGIFTGITLLLAGIAWLLVEMSRERNRRNSSIQIPTTRDQLISKSPQEGWIKVISECNLDSLKETIPLSLLQEWKKGLETRPVNYFYALIENQNLQLYENSQKVLTSIIKYLHL